MEKEWEMGSCVNVRRCIVYVLPTQPQVEEYSYSQPSFAY